MSLWTKILMILAVAFALTAVPNAVLAGCGACGGGAGHEDKKTACAKCSHEKVCSAEDCEDPAHDAECTCASHDDDD